MLIISVLISEGRVVEWLKRQRSNHATRVRIQLRSIYQECEFLINSGLGFELSHRQPSGSSFRGRQMGRSDNYHSLII